MRHQDITNFRYQITARNFELTGTCFPFFQAGVFRYLGAKDLPALRANARYIRVSPAAQKEATPHDVIEIKAGVKN